MVGGPPGPLFSFRRRRSHDRRTKRAGALSALRRARLGISENTVKSFCRRNNLTGVASKEPVVVCRNCGRPLPQYPKRKQRKFCSEACRRAWWKMHPELIHKAAFYPATCAHCGQEFQSYGNRKRKYCSHACYIAARFQKGGTHDEGTV